LGGTEDTITFDHLASFNSGLKGYDGAMANPTLIMTMAISNTQNFPKYGQFLPYNLFCKRFCQILTTQITVVVQQARTMVRLFCWLVRKWKQEQESKIVLSSFSWAWWCRMWWGQFRNSDLVWWLGLHRWNSGLFNS
jgi:hypothetical protein